MPGSPLNSSIGPKRRKRQRPGATRSSLPPALQPNPQPSTSAPLPAPIAPGRAGGQTGEGGESSLSDPLGESRYVSPADSSTLLRQRGQQSQSQSQSKRKRKPRIGSGANPVRSATMNLLRR